MKILVVSHDSGRTGAPIGLLALLKWLKETNSHEFSIILKAPGPLEASFREFGPTLVLGTSFLLKSKIGRRVRGMFPRRFRDEHAKIKEFAKRSGCQIVYSNTITNGAVLQLIESLKLPVVTHVHELNYWISRAGAENLRLVKRYTDYYIAASGAVKENLVANCGIPGNQISIVYEHIRELPQIPSEKIRRLSRERLGIPDGAFVVGGCGAEHWRKGRDLIPQLLVALRRRSPNRDVFFLWIGRLGTAEEENALLHDLKIAGVYRNYRSSGEVADPFEFFPAIDLFALLSRDDPYPLACLEVAGSERPIVCFAGAGGMPEFAVGGCGSVAPYLDIDTMASDIVRMSSSIFDYNSSAANARLKVSRENIPSATGPKIIEVLRAVLDESKRTK